MERPSGITRPPDAGSQSFSILIADDYGPWRDEVRFLLEDRPEWRPIYEACDGAEAVEKASSLQPDVIILDISMPGLNGIEVAQHIGGVSPKSRIIFLSGHCDNEIIEAAMTTGAHAYVVKTNAGSQLVSAVHRCCNGMLLT